MTTQTLLFLLGAYLVGSLPTAYIITKILTGEDIRQLGDGNVGAKNTFESVGKLAGFTVSLIDISKGFLTITAAKSLALSEVVILIAGACVVLGHDFSIFLGFQGGQGMAATAGVFGGLFPVVTLLAVSTFFLSLAVTKNWDLSCAIGFLLLIAGVWITGHTINQILFSILILPWIGIKKLIQVWQERRVVI
jgi:glycerol-3-phosphate acyltransferase PlsY